MPQQRDSGIELLRIVSMLMVLNVHTFFAPNNLEILTMGGGNLARLSVDFFREASSISCVNLFVLISGYFSIKWKAKSISSLVFQVYFWIFLVYAVCLIIGHTEFSFKELGKHIMGIMTGYWFIPAYIGLYVMSPILNSFINSSDNKHLLRYIIIFYIFQLLMSVPFLGVDSFQNGYSILSFCGLYMIGAYIKKASVCELTIFQTKTKVFGWIISVTLIIAASVLAAGVVFHRSGDKLVTTPLISFVYNNPLIVVQSILIFIFFVKLKIRSNFINWCAGGALAIYLLHMHPNIKSDYYSFAEQLYSESIEIQYLSIILLFIAVALIAIPVDKIRAWLFNTVYDKASNLLSASRSKNFPR